MGYSPPARARVGLAVSARDVADMARGIVGDSSTDYHPGERIRSSRRIRLAALAVVDQAVIAELSEGASWDEVAAALGVPRETAIAQYSAAWIDWSARFPGHPNDSSDDRECAETAETVDMWWRRHADPWEAAEAASSSPVTRALAIGAP